MVTRSSPGERPARHLRWGGTLALTGLALLALQHQRGWQRAIDAGNARAAASGISGEELADFAVRSAREADRDEARLVLADALLGRELAHPDLGLVAGAERLAQARELAAASLARLPASSAALMIEGAAISVLRSRAQDPRLISLYRDWERPLERAIELAPGDPAPRRLLAAAYVDVWPVIAPAKRAKIEPMLREAFLHPPTFERLFPAWIEIAGSLDAAAALLPDRPRTWQRLAEVALGRRDWGGYGRMRSRERTALGAALDARLVEAEASLARGDAAAARGPLAQGIVELPVELEFAPRLERALALLPPGNAGEPLARAAAAWFAWAKPLCLVRGCPLGPAAMGRLASLAGAALPAEDTAFAALAAGDRTRADLLERRSDTLWSEAWAPYFTFKAATLEARGESVEARLALRDAHRAFRARVAWSELAEKLRLDAATASAASEPAMAAATALRWEGSDWWWERGAVRLDLLPGREASGLLLTFAGTSPQDALVMPLWDGAALPPLALPAGSAELRLPVSVTRQAHLLELRPLAGSFRPAPRVTLD